MTNFETLHEGHSTGVVYDDEMVKHLCHWDPNYPERPERYSEIIKRCQELSLLERCKKLPSRNATEEELSSLHTSDIISLLRECEDKSETELEDISSRYDSVYICKDTYKAALLSAGSTIRLVEAVCKKEVKNGMAIVRPPGHHAMKSEYCGYCFFNNVALAANYALKELGMKKILIVDWDVHHGQATQQMFYNDPRVLYFSIHRFDHGLFWPNLAESNCDFIGEGSGKGYNFNVPLNKIGLGNADYLAIFQELLIPVATEFQPELIIVSAGYDAALGCPEGEMMVTPACYAHFINALSVFACGRIAVILEGGYFLKSLAEGASLTLRALLGDPCPKIEPTTQADESALETIRNVIYTHRPYWKCFQFYDTFTPTDRTPESDQFIPNFRFEGSVPRPEKYETRECYPTQSADTIAQNTNLLDDLIRKTSLHVPEFHYHLIVSRASKNFSSVRPFFENLNGITNEIVDGAKITQNISNAINQLIEGTSRSLIFDKAAFMSKTDESDQLSLSNQISINLTEKRVVFINLHTQQDIPPLAVRNNFLHFSFANYQSDGNNSNGKADNHIEIKLDKDAKDHQYIIAWLKIVLPICYQFDPEVIVIDVDFQKSIKASSEVQGYMIRWLSSLAIGKTILVTDFSNHEDEDKCQTFSSHCRAFLGYTLPIPKSIMWPSDETGDKILKLTTQKQTNRWSNVKVCVKFPTEKSRLKNSNDSSSK